MVTESNKGRSQRQRAMRVMGIRKSLGLSRKEFTKNFGIALGTLQHWERPDDQSGLTEKGAEKLVKVLLNAGVQVSADWLLYGAGAEPMIPEDKSHKNIIQPKSKTKTDTEQKKSVDTTSTIEQELQYFHQLHDEVVSLKVPDDGMEPALLEGDYVAGIRLYKDDIKYAVGKDCIVMTEDGELAARRLVASDIPGLYDLQCRNFDSKVKPLVIYNVELVFAAPIVWVRRG